MKGERGRSLTTKINPKLKGSTNTRSLEQEGSKPQALQ